MSIKARAKVGKTKTTRDTRFNSFLELQENIVDSVVDITATKTNPNIRLLNANDGLRVVGELIREHAKANTTLVEMGHNVVITDEDLQGIDEGEIYYLFGAPHKMILDNRQAYNDCGVVSTMNTLVTAGKYKITDQNKTENEFLQKLLYAGLVDEAGEVGVMDEADGGTSPNDYKEIFEYYGISSDCYFFDKWSNPENAKQLTDLEALGKKIAQGCGAVIGVSSSVLWKNADSESGEINIDHAVTITGVVYDGPNPETAELKGFYIHDSGAWMTRYISLKQFEEVTLYDEYGESATTKILKQKTAPGIFCTITQNPIKEPTDNINATGNSSANIIYGNDGDNTIKGLGGKDKLYGSAGNDTIYGGNGNDIIFGNGVISDDVNDFIELVSSDTIASRLDDISYVKSETVDKALVGRNILYGGAGSDIIFGGAQNDLIHGGDGADYIYTSGGKNAVYAGNGNDIIYSGNDDDRLFGEAGNDIIYGFKGDDAIHGGSGNDTIYGGNGDDRIECGSGNDKVIFEEKHGNDTISSKSGSVVLQFDNTENGLDDLNINFEKDNDNEYKTNIKFTYDNNDEDKVTYLSFFNSKTNVAQNLTLETKNGEDYDAYRLSVTTAQNVKVADTSTSGSHARVNNILFTTGLKNTTITTSKKDDIVYMMDAGNEYIVKDLERKDKITYTGGTDIYHSYAGDTAYIVKSFDENTNLTIYDNKYLLKKVGEDIAPSANDSIKFNTNIDNLAFFFDIEKDSDNLIVSDDTNLYVLNKSLGNDLFSDVVSSKTTVDGTVTINSFFNQGKSFTGEDMYGNGRIEGFSTNDDSKYDLGLRIFYIKEAVANWFDTNPGYTSVFEAIEDDAENLDSLLACYTNVQYA